MYKQYESTNENIEECEETTIVRDLTDLFFLFPDDTKGDET